MSRTLCLLLCCLGALGCIDDSTSEPDDVPQGDRDETHLDAGRDARTLLDARVELDSTIGRRDADTPDATHGRDAAPERPPLPEPELGTLRLEIAGPDDRTLPVQLWYPARASMAGSATVARLASELEPAGERRSQLAALLTQAPAGCASQTIHASDAPPAREQSAAFPLVVMSHCHSGTRFGMFTIAEQLASAGFVVAAVDHVGDTLYDSLAGKPGSLSPEQLERRRGDVDALLDVLLDHDAAVVPVGLRGRLDAARVGLLGHSFGAITSGLVTSTDPRIAASVFIAAPPTFPILSPTMLAQLDVPALFFYASEDNSLPGFINEIIRSDFAAYPREAWLVEFADAGHFAFSDLAGITDELSAGCGSGLRQTQPLVAFEYLDPAFVRAQAASYVRAFFERQLQAGPGLLLDQPPSSPSLTLKRR